MGSLAVAAVHHRFKTLFDKWVILIFFLCKHPVLYKTCNGICKALRRRAVFCKKHCAGKSAEYFDLRSEFERKIHVRTCHIYILSVEGIYFHAAFDRDRYVRTIAAFWEVEVSDSHSGDKRIHQILQTEIIPGQIPDMLVPVNVYNVCHSSRIRVLQVKVGGMFRNPPDVERSVETTCISLLKVL